MFGGRRGRLVAGSGGSEPRRPHHRLRHRPPPATATARTSTASLKLRSSSKTTRVIRMAWTPTVTAKPAKPRERRQLLRCDSGRSTLPTLLASSSVSRARAHITYTSATSTSGSRPSVVIAERLSVGGRDIRVQRVVSDMRAIDAFLATP
jgi:hypothetical protein